MINQKHKNISLRAVGHRKFYRVRVTKEGTVEEKDFTVGVDGISQLQTLNRAIRWRDNVLVAKGMSNGRKLPVGVTLYRDSPKKDTRFLQFRVTYNNGKNTNKAFIVGELGKITFSKYKLARKVACLFREQYVRATALGLPFDEEPFSRWRDKIRDGVFAFDVTPKKRVRPSKYQAVALTVLTTISQHPAIQTALEGMVDTDKEDLIKLVGNVLSEAI